MNEIIINDQLTLKPIKKENSTKLFDLIQSNRENLREWLGWLDRTKSVNDTDGFINSCLDSAEQKSGYCFLMWSNENLAGIIHLVELDQVNKKAAIGYWVGKEYRGNSFTKLATQSIVQFAHNTLKLNRIEIRCATKNTASQAIPKSLGFKEEGILRENEWLYDHFVDHVVFSTNKKEWNI